MAKNVSEKNTKAQILDAYQEVIQELNSLKEAKKTTADVVKEKKVKETKEAAKEVVGLGILNDDVVAKYNALMETKEMLEKEIEELYGIKAEVNSLEALINTRKDMETALVEKYAKKEKELEESYKEKAEELANNINSARMDNAKELTALKESFKEAKADLERDRKREEEQYNYDLERKRAKEDDEWADIKANREKELAVKEIEVKEREIEAEKAIAAKETLEKEIELLNNKVEEVRTTAFEEGKAKAKKEADTAKVFSDRAHKADLERKDDRIATLEAALEESKKAHESDKAKLDAAYTRIQEMAIEAAKNSGVRMVESNNK